MSLTRPWVFLMNNVYIVIPHQLLRWSRMWFEVSLRWYEYDLLLRGKWFRQCLTLIFPANFSSCLIQSLGPIFGYVNSMFFLSYELRAFEYLFHDLTIILHVLHLGAFLLPSKNWCHYWRWILYFGGIWHTVRKNIQELWAYGSKVS